MNINRKAIKLTLILSLLVSGLAGTLLIQNRARIFIVQGNTTSNNTIVDGNTNANVTIQEPENKTYNENNVTLAFTIESDVPPTEYFNGSVLHLFLRHGCVLDYSTSKLVGRVASGDYYNLPDHVSVTLSDLGNRYVGNGTLTGLSQGPHNVTVWIRADTNMISYSGYEWSVFTTVSFNVDSPPKAMILSPETKTYNTSVVRLDFTINEKSSRMEYSLDGQSNVTINGNTTLSWLPNGNHNVTVYATDETGNTGASETRFFTTDAQESLSVLIAIASAILVVVVGVGLLVYFKKRSPPKQLLQK